MFCRLHDDQRAGSFLKQRISIALQIGNQACNLGFVRDAFEEIFLHTTKFFELVNHCSILLFLPVFWVSGWYEVPYFRC